MAPPPLEAAAAFGLDYRAMTDEDLPFVAALYASTRAEELAATGLPPETQAAFLDMQHRAQHQHYRASFAFADWLIVEQSGVPVGRLYLDESDSDLHLIDIALVPEKRGAGLGGAMMADLLAHAERLGKTVSLFVEEANPARRLYGRLGFAPVEQGPVYLEMLWRPPAARP